MGRVTGKEPRINIQRLRKLRSDMGLSLANMARILGCTPVTVFNWEHGICQPDRQSTEALNFLSKELWEEE